VEPRIEMQCRASGLRLTSQRRLIAEVLAEATDHPHVRELHRRVSARRKHISLATVYRTLKAFEAAGIAGRHTFCDGRIRCEQTTEKHHDHLIDLEIGKIIDFRSEEIERLQADIARRLGYRVVDHRLELYARPIVRKSSGVQHRD